MKKLLLLGLVVSLGLTVSAQQLRQNVKSYSAINKMEIANAPEKPSNVIEELYAPNYDGKNKFVTIIDIGTSANAYGYGYGGGQKSILAYNSEINTVTHFHRMGGDLDPGGYSGDLGYDVSTDGGMNFTNMVECYVATENGGGQYFTDAARYPNHGIYNPMGNTDPANAYVSFFVPTLDGSNSPDSWGGYGYGVSNIGDPSYTTKHLVSSDPGDNIYRYIPDGFCLTNTGEVWVTDINQDWSTGSLIYTGYLLVSHGVWNDELNDFEYEEFLLDCPVEDELVRPAMSKVEFSPDGQTGYIMALGDNGELDFSLGTYFPIIWKTTDGGETWDDPFEVEIAGPDGIEAIMWYMSEEEWQSFWAEPYPERDEVRFTCAFDFDLTVDHMGNPHIGIGVGVASLDGNYSLYTSYPYYAMTDIWSPDGGDTWDAFIIDRPKQFRSNFDPDFTEDNRVQISRDHAGEFIFVSYMDTHLEGEENNDYPDIMCRAIWPDGGYMSYADSAGIAMDRATNVTNLSDGMWQAYFMVMANEVIDVSEGSSYLKEFVIPFSYEELNIANVGDPVQFKYIQDFSFGFNWTGVEEMTTNSFNVEQNYPNPFSGQTDINVTLNNTSKLTLDVYNLMGQNVYSVNAGEVTGNYTFTLNADFEPGVYFYTVTAGTQTISKKMIVE
jgi:hypothetical protein